MFVYDSISVYFNLQYEVLIDIEGFWVFDVFFEGGKGIFEKYDGSDDVFFVYLFGIWFLVYFLIDIDSDYVCFVINERIVDIWLFSSGSMELSQMYSINFYLQNIGYFYFIDDISLLEILVVEVG